MGVHSYTFEHPVRNNPANNMNGTHRKMSKKWSVLAPKIVGCVFLVAIVVALIVVSVILSQKSAEVEQRKKDAADHAATEHGNSGKSTTVSGGENPWGSVGPDQPRPTVAPIPAANYRLLNTVIPSHYALFLHVHLPYNEAEEKSMDSAWTTKGSWVAITLRTFQTNLDSITLHARTETYLPAQSWNTAGHIKAFTKESVTMSEFGGAPGPAVTDVRFERGDIVVIKLATGLAAGANYTLTIRFDGFIANDNAGLYRSSYIHPGMGEKRWLVGSQFQPSSARKVFPCFDEPGIRSEFTTTLKYPDKFRMVRTNGLLDEVLPVEYGWRTEKFKTTPSMPVYLNAFFFGDAEFDMITRDVVERMDNGTRTYPINVIANYAFYNRSDGDFAVELGRDMMQQLYVDFNQSYPLGKLDMVAIPDFSANAMENWGLVLYRDAKLLYRPKVSTADTKRVIAELIGHELAHMIFGNLLTCAWWNETWLNEGFARYMQYDLMDKTRASFRFNLNVREQFPYWITRQVMESDSYNSSHALSMPADNIRTSAEIGMMFDSVTYAKGAAVLRMTERVMTKDKFFAGLKTYVQTHKFSSVVSASLLAHLDMQMPNESLPEHLRSWTEQSGYPVITLTRHNSDPTDITYVQEEFLIPTGSALPRPTTDKVWHIPLTLTHGSANSIAPASRNCWLTQKTGKLTSNLSCPAEYLTFPPSGLDIGFPDSNSQNYIIANVQQQGYYRVNYDVMNWFRISLALHQISLDPTIPAHLGLKDPVTRGQLIDDAFNLARVGKLPNYTIPLEMINSYVMHETKFTPFASVMDGVGYIEQMFRGTAHYEPFVQWVRGWVGQLYSIGMWLNTWQDPAPGGAVGREDYDTVMFKTLVIETGCYYGLQSCMDQAYDRFKNWRTLAPSLSPPGVGESADSSTIQYRYLVWCYGLRHPAATLDDWNFLKSFYNNSRVTTAVKLNILRGLACTRHESLLQQVLGMINDGTSIRRQDMALVLGFLNRFQEGSRLAWDFVRSDYANLARRSTVIWDVIGSLKDTWRLGQLRDLYGKAVSEGGPDIDEGPTFVRAIAKVQGNVEWFRQHADNVVALVKTLNSPGTPPKAPVG